MTRVTENFDGYPAGSSLNWQSVNNGFVTPALATATSAPNAGQAAGNPGVRLAVNAGAVGSMNDDVSCGVNVYVATPTNPSGCAGAYLAGISDRFNGYAATLFWDGAEVAVRLSQLSGAGTTSTALLEAPTANTLTSHWYTVELRYDPASAQLLAYCYAVGGSRGTAVLSYPIDQSTAQFVGGLMAHGVHPATDTDTNSYLDDWWFQTTTPLAPAAITGFSPASGPPGTVVTITGTGFSGTPSGNTVAFNGAVAAVTGATTTQLTVTVPNAATSGPISVSVAGQTSLSAAAFTVTAPGAAAPTVTGLSPTHGPVGTLVTIIGTNFSAVLGENGASFAGSAGGLLSASVTQLIAVVPAGAVTGPVSVTVGGLTGTSSSSFTVDLGSGKGPSTDTYTGSEDEGPLAPGDLLPFLRAMLKDTVDDLAQEGVALPVWSDASLYRYLELARGEYSRHRPVRARQIVPTVAGQQTYAGPAGTRRIEDVLWAPAGYDIDQLTALLSALSGGPGMLWGGGVPILGQIYFDSPASIKVWSIIREAWRNTFGGRWRLAEDPARYDLLPCPLADGNSVLVFYEMERHWSAIPWEDRTFILAQAVLYAVEALTYGIISSSTSGSAKLSVGLRGLVDLVQQKYAAALNIRQPGIAAGRS